MFCNPARVLADRAAMINRQFEIAHADKALELSGIPERDRRRALLSAEFARLERLCEQ